MAALKTLIRLEFGTVLRRALADLLYFKGVALLAAGNPGRAWTPLSWAARLFPDAGFLCAAAVASEKTGKTDRALECCERALRRDPEHEQAHTILTRLYLHGDDYSTVLARLHAYLKPRTYVEIGVESGRTLALAAAATHAIGIDPEPKISQPLPPQARVFADTSDGFFATHDLRQMLGGLPVDLAFIDGMHHFEYALRDFMNLERACTRDSTILVHDCFPHDRRTAERDRQAHFWTGDVWRLVLLLRKYRPDLAIHTIAAPPSGLTVIRNLDPSSSVLSESLQRLCDEFLRVDYSVLRKDRARKLALVPNEWEGIRALLSAAAR